MGMFDTFVGEIECPFCNKVNQIEEQTKSYNCLLRDFKTGDYIDKSNTNYFYQFDCYCKNCGTSFNVYAAIRRGQLVGYYPNRFDICELDNIIDKTTKKQEHKQIQVLDKKSWEEFMDSGMLWWINMILHTFGWAICCDVEENGRVSAAYPIRVKLRGFGEKINSEGYIKVSKFLKNNADELLTEAKSE